MSDSKFLVRSTLSSSAHLSVNKLFIKVLGLNCAVFLADLITRDQYWDTKGKPNNGDFFFCEQKVLKAEIGLNEHEQRKAVKKLESLDILETKREGIPPRIWFRIIYDTVITNILKYEDINIHISTYNNKNKYNNTSKEVKEVSPPVKVELPFLLKEWRTYKQIPNKQKHPKENSKTHKRINFLTELFLKGKFNAHCDIKLEFLQQNQINKKVLSRKFTKDELLAGLEEMAEMFKLNNQPENKDSISKMSFDTLIYHPTAKISYLLKYMYTDVQPLAYKTVEVYGHWLDKLYEEGIFDQDIENDNHQFGIFKKGLASIEEYYAWVNKEIIDNLTCYSLIDTEDKFFNVYVDWLGETYNSTSINANPWIIGAESKSWCKFIKWLEEAIHGDFKHQYPSLDRRNYGK